ncbi:MAG TPA: TRAP transporter small permease [Rhodocyclaceae bacterium]|nr:TRAP transporter small permease [Rhodocyclaceae bacterium]
MILKRLNRGLEWLLIAMLALMVVMVFGNVVLRYVFNSSILSSEEVSRFLFVWVVFVGSVLALKDNAHLGVHMVTEKLPMKAQRVCKFLGDLMTFLCCLMMIWGTWKLVVMNLHNAAPVTGMPYGYVYIGGVVGGVGMALLLLHSMYRLLTGKMQDSELSSNFEDVL